MRKICAKFLCVKCVKFYLELFSSCHHNNSKVPENHSIRICAIQDERIEPGIGMKGERTDFTFSVQINTLDAERSLPPVPDCRRGTASAGSYDQLQVHRDTTEGDRYTEELPLWKSCRISPNVSNFEMLCDTPTGSIWLMGQPSLNQIPAGNRTVEYSNGLSNSNRHALHWKTNEYSEGRQSICHTGFDDIHHRQTHNPKPIRQIHYFLEPTFVWIGVGFW